MPHILTQILRRSIMTNSFVIATEDVQWGTGERAQTIQVRGLSYQDFVILFTTFGKGVDQIFNFIDAAAKGGSVANVNVKEFGAGLIADSPAAAALLIALAADMPDRAKDVARMPLPAQIKAMEKIYDLTVTEAGGLADFLALVTRIARSVATTTRSLNSSQLPEVPDNILATGS